MKTHFTTTFLVFLFITFISIPMVSQNYTPPSRALVLSLLERIENCKEAQDKFKDTLSEMEANQGDYTLREYNEVKQWIENAQTCLNSLRWQLDELREEYPGWFNDPSAVFDIDRNHSIKPRELDEILEDLKGKIDRAIERFNSLQEPEH